MNAACVHKAMVGGIHSQHNNKTVLTKYTGPFSALVGQALTCLGVCMCSRHDLDAHTPRCVLHCHNARRKSLLMQQQTVVCTYVQLYTTPNAQLLCIDCFTRRNTLFVSVG
jgi:hypothetical protein